MNNLKNTGTYLTIGLIFFLICMFTLQSCCKCKGDSNDVFLAIRDKQNGSDLLFGPSKRYDAKELKIFSFIGTDTVSHHFYPSYSGRNGFDSVIELYFNYRKLDTVYLLLSPGDLDTLRIDFSETDRGCCKGTSFIKGVYRNGVKLSKNKGVTILEK